MRKSEKGEDEKLGRCEGEKRKEMIKGDGNI
jgi:hypothetical protein